MQPNILFEINLKFLVFALYCILFMENTYLVASVLGTTLNNPQHIAAVLNLLVIPYMYV